MRGWVTPRGGRRHRRHLQGSATRYRAERPAVRGRLRPHVHHERGDGPCLRPVPGRAGGSHVHAASTSRVCAWTRARIFGSANDASLSQAVASLGSATALLSSRVGTAADITRVGSQLPDTLTRLRTQQATTRSALLVALLLDTMLGIAALVLAGRLLAESRLDEQGLLTTLGLAPRQRLASALVEAVLLAVGATVLAVPAAALAFASVMHLPDLRAAGLAAGPRVTSGLVVTVLGGAVLLTLVLVVSPLISWDRPAPGPTKRSGPLRRRRAAAGRRRSGLVADAREAGERLGRRRVDGAGARALPGRPQHRGGAHPATPVRTGRRCRGAVPRCCP